MYGFKSRKVAVDLRNFAMNGMGVGRNSVDLDFNKIILVATPSHAGLARTNTSPDGSAYNEFIAPSVECNVVSTYTPGSDVNRLDSDEVRTVNRPAAEDILDATPSEINDWKSLADMKVLVHNPNRIHIENDAFYFAVWCDGNYVFADKGSPFRIFLTPSGGIPARSGTTLGKATCTLYYLSFDGTDATLAAALDAESSGITATVFNMGLEAVNGSSYTQAVAINGLYVANWEDCGAS